MASSLCRTDEAVVAPQAITGERGCKYGPCDDVNGFTALVNVLHKLLKPCPVILVEALAHLHAPK